MAPENLSSHVGPSKGLHRSRLEIPSTQQTYWQHTGPGDSRPSPGPPDAKMITMLGGREVSAECDCFPKPFDNSVEINISMSVAILRRKSTENRAVETRVLTRCEGMSPPGNWGSERGMSCSINSGNPRVNAMTDKPIAWEIGADGISPYVTPQLCYGDVVMDEVQGEVTIVGLTHCASHTWVRTDRNKHGSVNSNPACGAFPKVSPPGRRRMTNSCGRSAFELRRNGRFGRRIIWRNEGRRWEWGGEVKALKHIVRTVSRDRWQADRTSVCRTDASNRGSYGRRRQDVVDRSSHLASQLICLAKKSFKETALRHMCRRASFEE
jgi:hypothetical protein